ncbi:hypothetical protein LCGC14_2220980 [marine sediment metagenome]|uniref:Uncharacterized protein n=1 Tax=marine sediment metagenome TaxID=412755 RepID=A0A0F9DB41_9ZZZZ
MAFRKNVTIYEKGDTKVYINQCHNPGKKTNFYAVRKDWKSARAEYLGSISWNGAWRQYCFYSDDLVFWSSGCLKGIVDFLERINKEHRKKIRK